jgi:hypothetical protein
MSGCLVTFGRSSLRWLFEPSRRWGVVVLALGGLMACDRGRSSPRQVAPSARTAALLSTLVTPSAAPNIAAPPAAEPQRPEAVLMAWNGALDRHAVEQLRPLYAAHVLFYGQRLSAEQVLEAKKKALANDPSFRQRISEVRISRKAERVLLGFEKRSGKALKNKVYGSLVLAPEAGSLKIVEESDDTTDAKFRPEADTCPEAAMTITSAQPRIQADIERVAREYPDVNPGGLSYDQTERSDRYSGSMGYFHPERYEPRWLIDAADGKLMIRDLYSEAPLPLTAAQQALVKKLCAGKAEPESETGAKEQR